MIQLQYYNNYSFPNFSKNVFATRARLCVWTEGRPGEYWHKIIKINQVNENNMDGSEEQP